MGCKRFPKSFDLLKIWAKALKILVKMASNVVWLHAVGSTVCIKKHESVILEVTPKRGLHDLCGRKFAGKVAQKTFRQVWGESGKILRTSKICLLLHLWWKGTSSPVATLLKGQKGKCLAMPPFSGVPVHIILRSLFARCCTLQCVTVMNINYSGQLKRSRSWQQKYPATR